ncbi:MAG TPA: SDR family oxidoreductase [Campylobacteraceae bacterium]|jgi:short-subunit dehydrogenase|nr:SDR family oxidoreductase [Campylobacteraceae bacterium]HHD83486.1 SDR family oxidoreductase [Campylobacteraceae bacterium]
MKNAIVTGASSGIGLACATRLLQMGYKVIGVSRDFSKCECDHHNFVHLTCDLTQREQLLALQHKIDKANTYILINAAGVGHFAPHEALHVEQIEEIIALNLTAPLILSKLFLKPLKQNSGYIFNIGSISARQPALFGAAYGASKAGLQHFGLSLFKEARKSGLKVVNIEPDITNTNFFDTLRFHPAEDPQCYIEPDDIAQIVADTLTMRTGTVITNITVEPQKFKLEKRPHQEEKRCKKPQ